MADAEQVEEFKGRVAEYVGIGDSITQANDRIKVLKKRMIELEEDILEYMEEKELDICHLADGTKLRRTTTKRQGPFNAKTVKEVIQNYMEPDKLNEAFGVIDEKRGEQVTVSLKRLKR
jgi:hypothetical protein